MDGMTGWALSAFLAFGGLAFIWSIAKKHIPKMVDKGFDYLLTFPKFRKWVADNADAISEIIDKVEDEIIKDIKEAKEKPILEVPPTPPAQ